MEAIKHESSWTLFCNACLCVGRKLYQITDEKSKHFYLGALSEIPLFDMATVPSAVCWECRILLRRAVQFREQVKDSYRILVTWTGESILSEPTSDAARMLYCSILRLSLEECLLSDVSRPSRFKIINNGGINIEPTYTYELFDDCDTKNSNGKNDEEADQDTKDSPNNNASEDVQADGIQCTQRVFVKEELKVKLEDSDTDGCMDGLEDLSIPIDNLAGIDNEIKSILNEVDKKRTNKVKRKRNLENIGRSKKKVKKRKEDTKDSSNKNASEDVQVDGIQCTQRVFVKEELKIKLEDSDIDGCTDGLEDFSIPIDNLAGIDNEIKSILTGVDKKRTKKVKRKRTLENIRRSKKKVMKRKDINGIPRISTIDLTYEEMTEERIKEYTKDGYINAEYKCESCIMGFNYHKSYKTHLTAKHSSEIGDYTCPICKTVLVSVDAFTAHYKRHMRRYECSICQKRTMDFKVMEQHYFSSHEISLKKYKCSECGLISKSIDSHRYHMDTHKSRLQCTECDKTFRHRGGLLNHRLTVHELNNAFPCNVCNKVFRWRSSLKRHLDSHHDKDKSAQSAAFCALCNISFASLSSYQRHMTNSLKHVTKEDFRFICDHCNRRFANKTKLRDHIEEKHLHLTYQCQICLKVSKNRVNLDQHIRNVHKGRPNNKICHHCGKGFPTIVQLESHIRTHTGERPFICEFCPTTFSQQSNLYKHNRQVHLNMKSKRYPLPKKRKDEPLPISLENTELQIEYNPIEIDFHI